MTLDDIELGQEVICTRLRDEKPAGNTAFRGIGHIGRVRSIFPWDETIHIGHIEYTGRSESGYSEFYTAYFVDELELFEPPERKLKQAITKTLEQINEEADL